MWPVFTRTPGRVYAACSYSHDRSLCGLYNLHATSSLFGLYLLAWQVEFMCYAEFMWRVFTRMSRGVYVACIQPTRMLGGIYVACIYSHAWLSLCGLYLLPSLAEFMWPVYSLYPSQVEFMWPVFTPKPGWVYVACIYSQSRLILCGLYLLPIQVEFMWPVFTPKPGWVYVTCIYSQSRLSLCGLYLLPSQTEFMWPVFTPMPDAATVGDSGLCCLYSYPCDVCGALSICPLACWCH